MNNRVFLKHYVLAFFLLNVYNIKLLIFPVKLVSSKKDTFYRDQNTGLGMSFNLLKP